jgi:hypothetical protein
MKKFLAAASLALLIASGSAFAAVPSLQQIQQSITQGNWQQADAQLSQVIDAYPDNARARYLYGQVLDREGRPADALAQIERAKSLDPQIRFTDPAKFARTEAKVRADAERLGAQARRSATAGGQLMPPQTSQQLAPAAPPRHEPSTGMWIGFAVLIGAVALVLRWTLRRARSSDTQRGDDERRAQLKRATDLLNEVRPLKLDARLSTTPGVAALNGEIENIETQARTLVETLSNGKNPVPPYQLDELERQFASVKARVEGRPDPAATSAAAPASGPGSVYAQEADRLTGAPQAPYPPQAQPQPTVVVQQGGGFGGGMGGLLTGVLLGQAMSGGRERVIERDVIVNDDSRQRANEPGFDLGQGDSWDAGGGSGGGGDVDLGSSDDWSNNN